mmetsp:Transcript_43292/g.103175  ORF Transcript_43292/g.103175 Transcript_43292/m.103175 type:complete len:100 (-) Transcript_43292:140-439(-)
MQAPTKDGNHHCLWWTIQSFIGFPGSSEVGRRDLLALLHHQGALLLCLLHLSLFVAVRLPQAAMKNLRCGVVNFLPAMETAALAQGAHSIRERVVDIME